MIGWEGRLGDRPVRSLQGCTNENKVQNRASKKCIEHQNNSRQPGEREGEVPRGLVQNLDFNKLLTNQSIRKISERCRR